MSDLDIAHRLNYLEFALFNFPFVPVVTQYLRFVFTSATLCSCYNCFPSTSEHEALIFTSFFFLTFKDFVFEKFQGSSISRLILVLKHLNAKCLFGLN